MEVQKSTWNIILYWLTTKFQIMQYWSVIQYLFEVVIKTKVICLQKKTHVFEEHTNVLYLQIL